MKVDDEIVVTGYAAETPLDQAVGTGSRLGLTALERPESIGIIDADTIRARAYSSVAEAAQSLPGVIAGESPAAPSSFSIRGFTRSQITVLRDGLWVGPSNMVNRPQNAFNLERIEVQKGPASAVYGQGAISGVVNAVTRQAGPESVGGQVLTAYGRFDTAEFGIGAGTQVGNDVWLRFDASHTRSDGFIERMNPRSTNLSASLLWRPNERIDMRVSIDYLNDDLPSYWGTPLTPVSFSGENATNGIIETTTGETIDRRILRTNYNVEDAVATSEQLFLRHDLEVDLTPSITLSNTLWGFLADRDWANAEGFIFNEETTQIDRTNGYFFVTHDQETLGDRLFLTIDTPVGGFSNRLVVGADVTLLDFERARGFRFSPRPGGSVDLLNPVPGFYGPRELRGVSPTQINIFGLFAENRFEVTDQWSIIAGIRQEWLDLTRENFGRTGAFEAASSFERNFGNISWKIGSVYEVTDKVSLYGQFSTATDPVNANIFLVNAGEDFDLTRARQWEIGAKAILLDGRANLTVAYYDIERDDVLEQISVDAASTVGGRSARGVEVSGSLALSETISISANMAYTDASFRPSANFIANAGNRPPNVPKFSANLFGEVRDIAGLPLDIGASLRHVGARFGDNANTVTLKAYQLVDTRLAYRITEGVQVAFYVNNLFNDAYAPWADVFYLQQTDPSFPYANQVLLGAPRTYDLRLTASF